MGRRGRNDLLLVGQIAFLPFPLSFPPMTLIMILGLGRRWGSKGGQLYCHAACISSYPLTQSPSLLSTRLNRFTCSVSEEAHPPSSDKDFESLTMRLCNCSLTATPDPAIPEISL